MDCETYEARVLELEERLRASESRAAMLEGRLKALGHDLFSEAYDLAKTSSGLRHHSRVCRALETFGDSLEAIQQSRVDPLNIAQQAVASWRLFLAREVPSIIRHGDSHGACIERLCEGFQLMESGLASVTMAAFVEAAKVDLMVYKFEVYRVFMGSSRKEAYEIADCRLVLTDRWGKEGWQQAFRSHFPDYERLAGAHDLVHDAGIEAVYCFRKGDVDQAFDALGRMEAAGTAVWNFLDEFVPQEYAANLPSGEERWH